MMRKTQAMAVGGPEVLPPWKQEGYVAVSEARMKDAKLTTSTTQIRTEERWEGKYGVQERVTVSGTAEAASAMGVGVAAAKEVRGFCHCRRTRFSPEAWTLTRPVLISKTVSVCLLAVMLNRGLQKLGLQTGFKLWFQILIFLHGALVQM